MTPMRVAALGLLQLAFAVGGQCGQAEDPSTCTSAEAAGCASTRQDPSSCEAPPGLARDSALVQRRLHTSRRQGELALQRDALRPLTVLCWNVLYTNFGSGKEGTRQRIGDIMVDEMQADVAGLQECMNEDEMQSGLGNRMQKAPGTDKFNCIFYKPGVVEFGGVSGRTYLGDNARDNYSERYASHAKLRYGGVDFWLFSTHWCLDGPCGGAAGGERHKISAQVILAKREELGGANMPTIITADCNSHMDGMDNDDGVQWFLSHGFEIAGKGPMAGGIDYIFISKGHWTVGEHYVGPTQPSDHPSFYVKLTLAGAADTGPTEPDTEPPAPAPTGNNYRKANRVGAWGGQCTCPDGQVYNVGDNWDECGSLACEGGTPGQCVREIDSARDGMKVTCAPGDSDAPAPAPAPEPAPAPATTAPPTPDAGGNHYRRESSGVGGWGGTCTCPDGQVYEVGDNFDGCGSLACEGGIPSACVKEVRGWNGMKVTCASADGDSPAPDHYRKDSKVGGWGGWCTCPSGQRYNVGDLRDGCANGPQSLACEGGVPGECVKTVDEARQGMRVTCAAATAVDHYRQVANVGAWGGTCTCPSGKTYNVGDRGDACASLACEGGTPGECFKVVDASRDGMMVTCG